MPAVRAPITERTQAYHALHNRVGGADLSGSVPLIAAQDIQYRSLVQMLLHVHFNGRLGPVRIDLCIIYAVGFRPVQ